MAAWCVKHLLLQINPDRTSLRYENSPLLTESGPHYETVELHETNRQETSAPVDDDAPPLPPPYKSEDSQVQNGTSSMATIDVYMLLCMC